MPKNNLAKMIKKQRIDAFNNAMKFKTSQRCGE